MEIIEYLNHKLISSPIDNFENDLICINCGVRLEPFNGTFDLIKDYIPGKIAGNIEHNYNLSCEEQIIKQLIE